MLFSTLSLVLTLATAASAHFQLQFPPPRGPFVEDDEPKFCDGFNNAVNNRTMFPLSGGFFSLNSEHPQWSATVLVSTSQNPTSFDNFSEAIPFFRQSGEGEFCFPLNLSSTNVTGLHEGQNITIQVEFNGGDGALFQCADLTLSSSASLASQSCRNATGSASGSSTAPGSSPTNDAEKLLSRVLAVVVTAISITLLALV